MFLRKLFRHKTIFLCMVSKLTIINRIKITIDFVYVCKQYLSKQDIFITTYIGWLLFSYEGT